MIWTSDSIDRKLYLPRADWRDERDWRRPWRDPPGAVMGCCCTGGPCTVSCATVGDQTTESGSECTTCANQIVFDAFSVDDSASWNDNSDCIGTNGNGGAGNGGVFIDVAGSGQAVTGSFGGEAFRSFSQPAASGFCVQLKVTIVSWSAPPANNAGGLNLLWGRLFIARPSFSNYGRLAIDCNGSGCVSSTGHGDLVTFGPNPTAGDVITMIWRDPTGSGVATVCYQVNGTTAYVEENVSYCFPATMNGGIFSTPGNTGWHFDNFEIRTN